MQQIFQNIIRDAAHNKGLQNLKSIRGIGLATHRAQGIIGKCGPAGGYVQTAIVRQPRHGRGAEVQFGGLTPGALVDRVRIGYNHAPFVGVHPINDKF